MTKEQEFFLRCLSDAVGKRKTECTDGIDNKILCRYAMFHNVGGLVYAQNPSLSELADRYSWSIFLAVNRQKMTDTVTRLFCENKIDHIFLKGAVVAGYYPVPALRSMGDVDVLVRLQDKKKAHELLMQAGFENLGQSENEWPYKKDDLHLELHHNFCHDRSIYATRKIRRYTDNIWEYVHPTANGYTYEMEIEHHLAFLFVHIRQHFIGDNSGVGFRHFLDIVVLSNHITDMAKVRKILESIDLFAFAKMCFSFCQRWFGVSMPFAGEIPDAFFEESTQQIFANGVFGKENGDNAVNGLAVRAKKKNRLQTMLGLVFPGYRQMRNERHFRFVKDRPYLLPVAWIYRIVLKIKKDNFSGGLEVAVSPYAKADETEKRKKYFSDWGL